MLLGSIGGIVDEMGKKGVRYVAYTIDMLLLSYSTRFTFKQYTCTKHEIEITYARKKTLP